MRASPLQSLLARHSRPCTSSLRKSLLPHQPPCTRSISSNPPRRGPFSSTFGSSELLKRRYQPSPASTPLEHAERAKAVRRMKISVVGIIICAACMFGIVSSGQIPEPAKKQRQSQTPNQNATLIPPPSSNSRITRFDAPPSIAGVSPDTTLPENEIEQVPTGTSTIPTFPKTIHLASMTPPAGASVADTGEQEYQLVGLGIRTVSFLGIQVYVVGLYIAVADIAKLQERLDRVIDPVATALVPSERDKLKDILLDAERGEEVWNEILKDGGIRTAIRIVPTRNTDFMHLRDGWVRGITARTQHFAASKRDASFSDDSFGTALNDFKAIWGGGVRKNVPKGETLLLTRDAQGRMAAWYESKKGDSVRLGGLEDERVSRLIWLGYLGGKTVSSEGARKSVVDGVMDFVERPVGTVATRVV